MNAQAGCHQGAVALDALINAATNGSATDNAQIHLLHERANMLEKHPG